MRRQIPPEQALAIYNKIQAGLDLALKQLEDLEKTMLRISDLATEVEAWDWHTKMVADKLYDKVIVLFDETLKLFEDVRDKKYEI